MGKITGYAALASTQPDDLLVIVDVHDTSMAATGTDKKITVGNLVTAAAAGAVAKAGDAMGGHLAPAVVTLTDQATIAVDASAGNDFRVTITANRTMGAPANLTDGQSLIFAITQDATGSRTITWNAAYKFGAAGAPTLTTTANATDVLAFKNYAGNVRYLGSALGF
jgi:hypothetical protein